ncbi:MAG: hypothetical protein MUE33_00625 [Cytophagaceae bacterium]|jgi:hypothetical protein|nr:hypothetical protein [Cytophagaceae bacterium]
MRVIDYTAYRKYGGFCILHGIVFLCLILLSSPSTAYLSDSFEYIQAAQNLFHHGTWYAGDLQQPIQPLLEALRPPVFPIILFPSFVLFHSLPVYWVLQFIFSCTGLYFLWKIAHRLGFSAHIQSLLMLLYCILPTQYLYMYFVMSEVWFQCLWLVFFYIITLPTPFSTKRMYLISLVAAACIATKPIALLVIPIGLGYVLYIHRREGIKIVQVLFFPLLVYFFVSYTHYTKTKVFEFSSIAGHNLVNYNGYYFMLSEKGKAYTDSAVSANREAVATLSYPESRQYLQSRTIQYILDAPFSYALFHLKGMGTFFVDPGRFDAAQLVGETTNTGFLEALSAGKESILKQIQRISYPIAASMLVTLTIKLFLALSMVYSLFIKASYRHRPFLLLMGIVLCSALLTGPLGASRFWLPFMPFCLLWSAYGWTHVLSGRAI